MESFFGVGVVVTEIGLGGAGGGPQGIEGKLPESPCGREGSLGGMSKGVPLVSIEVIVVDLDLDGASSFASLS